MALATSLVTLFVYMVIPTIFAATTYSRSSLEIAGTNEQLNAAGRKFREINFPPKHSNPNEHSSTGAERTLSEVFPPNPTKSREQSLSRAGRKLSEIDFPTDLGENSYSPISKSVPVIPGLVRRYPIARKIPDPAVNRSRRPYKTVMVRGNRQGSLKGTQHIADLENDLIFGERTPLATSSDRLRPRPRLPAGPYLDDNGFGR